ncbi:MAG: DUF1840 domain-containing protein [Gammaproteobacteria bacterium]|nr:DUF1840 domain-containing protein [Gammaproteobacteria bacterium]
MLITFSCSAYADITMFDDVADHLLRLMGHSGTVCLRQKKTGDEEGEPVVSLPHCALPLIDLLKAVAKMKCNVRWDK